MKRILFIMAAATCAASCYDDYVGDYDKIAAGFANQSHVRTVVVGERMQFYTGVALGGTINNSQDRLVTFTTDYTLVNDALLANMKTHTQGYIKTLAGKMSGISPMPASMYEITTDGKPGTAVIKAGTHLGKIYIKIDPDKFLADEDNLLPKYIIPLKITSAKDCDIIKGKETSCIGVHYESLLFGNWWHGGVTEVRTPGGDLVETITYYTEVPQADNKVWTLTTVAPHSVTANAVGGELNGTAAQMKLTISEENGTVEISSVPGAKYTVEGDGESLYNKSTLLQNRKVVLRYKYVKEGNICHATDTLTFRNRIRDGVNEWQDENQNNY